MKHRRSWLAATMTLPLLLLAPAAFAQEAVEAAVAVADADPLTADTVLFWLNNTFMLLATFLVFIMHLGFSCIETGLTRSKNTVNILFKNVSIVAIGLITYYVVGFNLMYPGEFNGVVGFAGFFASADPAQASIEYAGGAYTYWTDFIFQAMFAATAATIVSGAVAERMKLGTFLIFSTIYVAIAYPIVGSWQWGGGWLSALGFHDFAGSTLVHSVGGWAALAGILVVGPRIGKYVDGTVRPIMGHNLPLAAIGMFLLWFGWFGFNGGSVLSADPDSVSHVIVTTSMAAATGIMGAILASLVVTKTPDLSMALNGALAGLVGITAGADVIAVPASLVVGFVAGVLVCLSVIGLDRLKLDDPVGAVSVHLVCGVWGTLAVGLFVADVSFGVQALAVLAASVCFPVALGLFYALKAAFGVRVSEEEELAGLDIEEHGMEAYSGFQIFSIQ